MIAVEDKTRNCALVMGILTGDMPNVDLIWASQTAEGHLRCFGQGLNCQEVTCPWRSQCLPLDGYTDADLPGACCSPQESYEK